MSLVNEYTNNFFMDESSILDAHLRLLFRAFHYETPCSTNSFHCGNFPYVGHMEKL